MSAKFTQVFDERAFTGEGRVAFLGRCFMFWQDGTRALGTVMWGKPLEADIEQMIPFFEIGAEPRYRRHASFVDGRKLESVDLLAFSKLLAYLARRRHAWGPNIGRQAVLHPSGVIGVMVAGALHVARQPYPFKTFEDDAEAFEWSGMTRLLRAYRAQVEAVTSVPPIVSAVRGALQAGGRLQVSEIAQRIGVSERTLQRRLEAAGTSLRDELERHVWLSVEQLLAGTDLTLDAIAAMNGFHSASHLARRFKQTHGHTPGEWRASHQRLTTKR